MMTIISGQLFNIHLLHGLHVGVCSKNIIFLPLASLLTGDSPSTNDVWVVIHSCLRYQYDLD